MNRAILIVICDFLVSAMLSMMTGMVPAHTGGTGVGLDERTTRLLLGELELRQRELQNLRQQLREAALRSGRSIEKEAAVRKITQELIDNMQRIEKVKRAQRATAANTGKLTPAELQARLEAEARKRLELEIKLRDQMLDSRNSSEKLAHTQGLLEQERKRLTATEEKLNTTTQAERAANAELRKLAAEYRSVQKQFSSSETARRLSERELAAARNAIAARDADLAGVKNALSEMNKRIGKVSLERHELQRSLAFTTGKLNTAERDNAEFKGNLRKMERTAAQLRLELAQAREDRKQMEGLVKRSRLELVEAQKIAEESKKAAAQSDLKEKLAKQQLVTTKEMLKLVTAKPAAEAFKRYSASAVKLNYTIQEKGLLLGRALEGNYVPVLVRFGNRTLAIAPFDILIGATQKNLLFRNIEILTYKISAPDGRHSTPLTSPMLAIKNRQGDRLGAFEITMPGRVPLKLISRKQLIERGTEDLFLFNCRKFGRSSATLVGRCSIDPRSDYPYLLIRNERSRNPMRLNAELGDIVVTRDGGFVGVVTGFEKNSNEARVLLFSGADVWDKAFKIPVVKKKGARFAAEFGDAVRKFKPQRQ